MLKRFLCCTLIFTLLAAAVPTIAVAGESGDALQKLMGMHYIDKLCAVNANAPDWHAGMTLTHANSQQMETALYSLLREVIQPTLEYLEETARAQVELIIDGGLSEEVRQARNECRALRDAVQTELDIIEYERRSLLTSAEDVFDGTYLTENQAEFAAQRVLLGVQRLENSMNVVSNAYSEWEDEAARLKEMMYPDDRTVPASAAPRTPLQSHIIGVRANYMNLLMDEAKRVAAEERGFVGNAFNREDEVEIYAVPRDKILFDVRDENNNPISDAHVSAWNAKSKTQFSGVYDADAEGYLFSTKSLGLEADGYLEIGYEIERKGYETHFANRHLCQGGDIFHTVMKETVGGTYISGASFNGGDIQWSQTNVYITDANDADQTVSVYLDAASGTPSGTVTMFFNDRDGNPQQRTAAAARGSDGRIHADFTEKWCRIFNIGDPIRFSLGESNGETVESLLMTNAPAVTAEGGDKPQLQTGNSTLMARFLPSSDLLKVTFPEDVPIFGGSSVGLSFPGEIMPVTVYTGIDGTFMLLCSKSKQYEDFLKKNVEDGEWKTESQEEMDRDVSNAAEEAEEDVKSAKSSFAKDQNSVKKPFLSKYTAWWSLFFCAQGKMEDSETSRLAKVTGQVSAGFVMGINADFTKKLLLTPPLEFGVGFSVGVGAMINGLFSGELEDCLSFNLLKLDLDFGAISILIPTSVYISLGVGVKLLQAGVKGCVSLNLALPIITDEYKKNVLVSLDMRITVYGQLLFAHVNWLIARLGWDFENGKSGPVNGYVIGIGHLPKNNAQSGFGMPGAMPPEAESLFEGTPVLGERGTDTNNLDVDTSVIWNYRPTSVGGSTSVRSSSTVPRKFEMYNGETMEMVVWAENNHVMISANGMANPQELVIPADPEGGYTPLAMAKKGIESGAYKIIDVNANSGDCHYDYVGSFRMPVQVAVVSITYAKSFKTEQQTVGGKTMDVVLPKETETLSMALVLTMQATMPIVLTTDQDAPAAYVFLNTTGRIKEFYPYPCQIHLKESPSVSGLPCIDTKESFGVFTGALFEDGTLTSQFYYYGNDDYHDEDSDCMFRVLETGTTGDVPVYIGVDEDGTIVSGIFSNVRNEHYTDFADGDEIDDFVLYDLADSDGEMVAFYLEKTAEEGVDALKAVPMQMRVGDSARYGEFKWASSEQWDFETDLPATKLNIDKLINYHSLNATLYWFDTGLKQIDGSKEKQEIARVRGVYFDWFHRKASKPFTIATLYGNDGENGGLTPNLAPLTSFDSGGQFYFVRVLEKENQEGEGDSVDWQQSAYRIYNAPISNIVKMRVVGASAEYHAMSAGRSGNFTFTLLNDGNMPITSATMRVSRILHDSEGKEIKETVAEYQLNPLNESANSARFWSVGSDTPDVRNGISAVHQIDTIFNSLTGDPIGEANAANDDSRILQSFLPETVFAYKGSIAIPEDWDGLQLLRAEIVNAYGPQTLSASEEPRLVMYDMERGGVYAVAEDGRVSSTPLLTAGGIPLRVEKSQPLDVVVDTAEIALSCKMHEKNGEKYIAAAISQTGNTAMNESSGNIILRAYVDDETEYPSFVHTFRNHTTGDIVLNLDAPVSTLTGGRKAEKLTLVVTDAADTNMDLSLFNNYQVFMLGDGLKWKLQPTDQVVSTGGTAVFTAEAQGGTQPYTYTWYRAGESGPQAVGQGASLILEGCTDDMDGGEYYCVVKDADGQTLTSLHARLTVQPVTPPPTGDQSHLYLWITCLACSAALLLFLLARKRRTRA